ncbi:MAG TPA: YidC/Oxa1 family insertase periplasmic-domain containing protein [Gemmataceae bacterium]|nr:YidC/Oxa1 family insertase periplasmic-domain containing protein [Gemmataceae bacterium]
MRQQTKNILLFIVLMGLCIAAFYGLKYLFGPPPPPPTVPGEAYQAVADVGVGSGGLWQGLSQELMAEPGAPPPPAAKPEERPAPAPVVAATTPPTPADSPKLKTLGEPNGASKFHLYVVLDPRGAGVRRVVLNKFQQANYLGRPTNLPEELVPADPDNLSNLLLAYEINDKKADARPLDTLGKIEWAVDGPKSEEKDGRVTQSVTFTSPRLKELGGLQVKKIFSLTQGEYHIGLEVRVERVDGEAGAVAFRYQLTGAHGLPVEGRWYTGIFRNALIGQVEKNKTDYNSRGVDRNYQALQQISSSEGGDALALRDGYFIRYAGVAIQYFASVIVVDDKQADGQNQDFLAGARPTLETAVVKGVVKSVGADDFILVRSDGKEQTFTIRQQDKDAEAQAIRDDEARFKADGRIPFADLQPNQKLAVVYSSGSSPTADGEYPSFARQLRDESMTQALWEDDVTVRVSTAAADVTKDHPLVHKYLLYNGPVKVMLLDQPDTAAERVAPGLVNRYIYDLNLNSMTDYQSASWIGSITGPTGISWMLIQITNLMHSVLWFLHAYLFIPYILCIICLTVMVRGAMFPVSRKQAMTSMKMMTLAPEMKKLQEKYKDDRQSLAAAQMEMYRKHGVNPFGTCWLLLLQMPIFMGLYYSLQESIHFRLAGVSIWIPWPPWSWMPNLSAPDMLLWWTEYIPLISQPSWYGWLCYLGPYLNILPVVAVTLMLFQQKWTMPPPTDDQQAQQQKMMKYMMIFMGLMFYKVASGLCIYFIASSVWGFAERRFLPKKKQATEGEPPAEDKPEGGILSKLLGPKPGNGSTPSSSGPRRTDGESRGGKGKRAKRRQESKQRDKDEGDGSMFQRLRAWWADILEQARKK